MFIEALRLLLWSYTVHSVVFFHKPIVATRSNINMKRKALLG